MADSGGPRSPKNDLTNTSTKVQSLSAFSVLCVFISLVTILADLTTGAFQHVSTFC